MKLIDKVRDELNSSGVSWREVAERSGVPYPTITRIASNPASNPTIENVQKLLDYFDSKGFKKQGRRALK